MTDDDDVTRDVEIQAQLRAIGRSVSLTRWVLMVCGAAIAGFSAIGALEGRTPLLGSVIAAMLGVTAFAVGWLARVRVRIGSFHWSTTDAREIRRARRALKWRL